MNKRLYELETDQDMEHNKHFLKQTLKGEDHKLKILMYVSVVRAYRSRKK